MPYNFTAIEKKWQQYWLANRSFRTLEPAEAGNMPKAYVLDMFPYPSGAGLHVGHVEQQAATDILCRYLRMKGFNVLHPMGWDAFGLPAEQYAIKTNTHPRITTEQNIANFRRQIRMLGLSYDWDREIDTTDPTYYRWTQWIFLQLFNSYFDPIENKAKPIAHLLNNLQNDNYVVAPDGSLHLNQNAEGLEAVTGEVRIERLWRELAEDEQRELHRRTAPRLHGRNSRQLVPRPRHRAGQRRSHRRQERTSAASPSSVSPCGNGCCASPPMPTPAGRSGIARLARIAEGNAAQLDRPQRRRRSRF